MKKIFAILVIAFVVSMSVISVFAGETINENEQKILDALSSEVDLGNSTYAFPIEYINQAKNYFLTVDVDEEAGKAVVSEIEGAFAYLHSTVSFPDESGRKQVDVFDLSALDHETKSELALYVERAAYALDLTLTYNSDTNIISFEDADGITVFENTAIIKKTGSAYSIIPIIALSTAMFVVLITVAFFLKSSMVKTSI